jgi:2-amino-4-hydroxy-6-hydroxymethyldihydropteridine diphosphokinase
MTNTAVISVGSNIDPERNVAAARELVAGRFELVASSDFIVTEAIGRPDQPDFLNGALLVRTGLTREKLRDALKEIENSLGRTRCPDKYAPRTIDLDIVVWNGEVVDQDYHTRAFVRDACRQVLPGLLDGGT